MARSKTGPRVRLWVWRYASLVSVSGYMYDGAAKKKVLGSYDLSFGYKTQLFAYPRSPHALVFMMPTNNAGFLVPVLANAALAHHSAINTYDFVDQYQLRFSMCEET